MNFNKIKPSAVSVAVTAALFSATSFAASLPTSSVKPLAVEFEMQSAKNVDKTVSKQKVAKQNYYIVRLESAPIVQVKGALDKNVKGNQLMMGSQVVNQHAATLQQERALFASQLASKVPGAQVERHFDTLMNAVVVKSKTDIFDQLKKVPGVSRVFKEQMFHANMDASLDLIRAKNVWENLGGDVNAGKDVRVAIVDSGIEPSNPMFSGEGFTKPTENMPSDDYCSTTDPDFCNDKLIVARYAMPTFTQPANEVFSPRDVGGHGTHVAGTAVGNLTSIEYREANVDVAGVAPGAYLMVYKGLFGGSGSNIMLMDMLERALEDGADVINNSWGGGYGTHPRNSAYAEVFDNIKEAGVVAIVAAGNGGSGAQTIGGPANLESVLSVANTQHGRVFGNSVSVDGESTLAVQSTATTLTENLEGKVVSSMIADADNFEGCGPFAADTFKDSIALISRGSCAFSDKIQNAADAGATAVVVHNNVKGAPIIMSVGDEAAVPAVMINKAAGESYVAKLQSNPELMLTIDASVSSQIDPESVDIMNASSSRGPNGDPSILKPNVAAPGTNILSAWIEDGEGNTQYGEISGTSMASPHIAGAAAVLKQMYPEWSAQEIKSAITNTSITENLKKDDAETPADAFDVGAGRLDMVNATSAKVTFGDLGLAEPLCVSNCSFVTSLKNMTAEEMTLMVSASSVNGHAVAEVSQSSITLAAHGSEGDSAEVGINLNLDMADFGEWEFARLEVHDAMGNRVAHLPLAALSNETSNAGAHIAATKVSKDEKGMISANFMNDTEEGQIFVQAKVPAGLKIDESSFVSSSDKAATILTGVDGDLNLMQWTGRMATSNISASGPFDGVNIKLADNADLTNLCNFTANCDEDAWTLNTETLGGFKFAGQMYNKLTITTNGLLIAGEGSVDGTWRNLELPSAEGQNNLIAPFWTDFDLDGTDAADAGNGGLRFAVVGDYIVVEWGDAALWGDDSGNLYTAQAWIRFGGEEEVVYNYPDLAPLPGALSIGMEDSTGLRGVGYHFNGTGGSVASGELVAMNYELGGSVSLSADVSLKEGLEYRAGQEEKVMIAEDSATDALDVMANDTNMHVEVARLMVQMSDTTEHAVQKFMIDGPDGGFDAATLEIRQQAANGTAVVADGKITYTPNANFHGEDMFYYSAKAADGTVMAPTKVMVTVMGVNDAPMATTDSSTQDVAAGATVSLAAAFEDVDGDALTYSWTQTSGTAVELADATAMETSFTAPTASSASTLVFEATATDGMATSDKVTVTVNVAAQPVAPEPVKKKSSSSSLFWLMLAAPLAFIRRRTK